MNAQIKKLTQAFPAFRLRLVDNKRWALMAGVGLAVAATAIIVSVLWTGNRGYVSLYGRQENLPVSQIVTVLDGEKLSYRIDPQSGQILVPEDELSKTRMTLAAKGVQAILPSGYELMDKDERLFQQLWKTYFKAICIKERWNPRKHRQDMPVRYWKYLTEKQE